MGSDLMSGRAGRPGVDRYRDTLLKVSSLSEPAIRDAVAALAPAEGSRGLDAGCGIGIDALKLAAAVGPAGTVTGIDVSMGFVEDARRRVAGSGLESRLDFVPGDLSRLPFGDGHFDWVWCRDVLWGHTPPPVAALRQFARVVRPGGTVALLFWSSQVLLPGHPELEARLMDAFTRTNPYAAGIAPDRHFLRALGWMREAGLEELEARTFAVTLHAPLESRQQDALGCALGMFFDGLEAHVPAGDWSSLRRLLDPDSSEYLPAHPDYCAVLTYTMFTGSRRP
jgi:demethylmenaquinone methyltransferase/2-methoxy-6-polyprenyl-1,4-benzoquinol methylase